MIDISLLGQYFPEINKPKHIGEYSITISLHQEDQLFSINLKIKQKDTKKEHLIKFRLGISKDRPQEKAAHDTNKPHFEIDIYKREQESFSATLYFTFQNAEDEQLLNYAKGTVFVINKILKHFIESQHLDTKILKELIYEEAVITELAEFEPQLINGLYECYKKSDLIVREPEGKITVIKTAHNLKKFLPIDDLTPLLLPLLKKIEDTN
ncbi:MAG: hypothetical protein V1659_03645 [Candidatus Woesearchaeota archaeon]